jgi:hypothetical protein
MMQSLPMPRTSAARPCPLPLLTPALLLAVGCATLAGCSTRRSDELALRREFAVPWDATVVRYVASPEEPGWFGREGLKITMVFRLSPAAAETFRRSALRSGRWRPLPIPPAELRHLAGIRTALASRTRLAQVTGTPLEPAGSLHNPSGGQMLESFQATLPPLPRAGWYQIRTAGDNIMGAPKRIISPLRHDVNDFMLAVLDPAQRTLTIRVSSNY